MAANNQIVVIGRLGANPELQTTQSGKSILTVSLAVSRIGKKDETDWVKVTFWEKLAEVVNQYAVKGSLISVSGSLRIETWKGNDGEIKSKTYIQAEAMQLLEGKKKE